MEDERHQIIIRCDYGTKVGQGHLSRCLSLAEYLKGLCKITLFINEVPSWLYAEKKYPWLEVKKVLDESWVNNLDCYSIVVLDGYHFEYDLEQAVIEKDAKLCLIDDFNNRFFDCDLLINQGIFNPELVQSGLRTKPLLGLDHVLLSSEFIDILNTKSKKQQPDDKSIFICFGASDSKNLTSKILSLIPEEGWSIHVVTGSEYNHLDVLHSISNGIKGNKIELYSSLTKNDLSAKLVASSFAIVPASNLLLECIALKIPVISGYSVDNQKNLYNYLKFKEAFVDAGDFNNQNFKNAFSHIIDLDRKLMEKTHSGLIDRQSPIRVKSAFSTIKKVLGIKVREAKLQDALLYYKWANDPSVRSNSYSPEEISLEKHLNWFNSKIRDAKSVLLLFTMDDLPMGQVRFDCDNLGWKIDYSIDSQFRRRGLGSVILGIASDYLVRIVKKNLTIRASVKLQNIASQNVFRRLSFEVVAQDFDSINFSKYLKIE